MKLTFIGAGSAVFSAELIKDILRIAGLENGTIALVDTDTERLIIAEEIARFLVSATGKKITIQASTNRKELLAGSDFVINSIEVGGPQNVENEYKIPLKYGVDQCIGDTIGPGGLFKALRTLPAWLDIVNDIMEYCPDALVMNYTNPMSLTVLAALRATGNKIKVVGLCHSIQASSEKLAEYLGIPYEDLNWRTAGINHMAWFVELTDKEGNNLYPKLKKLIQEDSFRAQDPVRFHLMEHFGVFMTESSGHISEYLPFIRKRADILEKYTGPGALGGSGYYAGMWPKQRAGAPELLKRMQNPGYVIKRGREFASYIIEGVLFDRLQVIHGNVLNTGLIPNLSSEGVVEVQCLIDKKGVQPIYFGTLPTHLAFYNTQHMAFHDLVVQSVLEQDREKAFHALMIDPLTSAVCSLDEIRGMFEEMVTVEKAFLPEYMTI
ncbi:MAG: alpha-glucosidase/alpha-galactosidase [Spirochaetes bacterium]|nr:alpha-glucosidase/alpha-galactosidase [Spirochaetota bacterium]